MDVVRLHQAGITYGVATLGTATTPEHLTRIFRVCNEVVFCFDGDRAGRAAAWRALENALSQIREGRQIRFLFLPEGHDPDSLVGEEGREKFEARLDGALALSDYFIRELSARSDINTVDGRAQFAEAAKPLLARIPEGVYRELLVDALARVIGMSPERLLALLDPKQAQKGTDNVGTNRPSERPTTNYRPPANVAGRSTLVRQAVHLLVHFPQAAQAVNPERLQTVDRKGVPLLIELINSLQANPCGSSGALLERWRDRPEEYAWLGRLAVDECVIDAAAAKRELAGAVERLIAEHERERQFNDLLNRGR
jgi:DNA primase